ncbi:hypothetical protein KKH05_00845 [Patescibacteria group bacterium]|nr:hypothetical protein [Patescibacteria group bacterium]
MEYIFVGIAIVVSIYLLLAMIQYFMTLFGKEEKNIDDPNYFMRSHDLMYKKMIKDLKLLKESREEGESEEEGKSRAVREDEDFTKLEE